MPAGLGAPRRGGEEGGGYINLQLTGQTQLLNKLRPEARFAHGMVPSCRRATMMVSPKSVRYFGRSNPVGRPGIFDVRRTFAHSEARCDKTTNCLVFCPVNTAGSHRGAAGEGKAG